jgi:NAD(P)-dependent dehydrogenase (short-subunit alcohol dehydrogenase family)
VVTIARHPAIGGYEIVVRVEYLTYKGAQGSVEGLVRVLANITVNAVAPGPVETERQSYSLRAR